MAKKKTTIEFINDSKKIFGELYDYTLTEYYGANKPIKYICKLHGLVEQSSATNHLAGKGCKLCKGLSIIEKKTKPYSEFLMEVKEIHKDLYKYPKTGYVNRKTKILILCLRCGKNFLQTPEGHLSGKGCNTCNRIKSTWQKEQIKVNFRKISKKHMFVYKTTNILNGKIYIGQHSTNNLKDGYKGSGHLISKALKKYGAENFKFEIIEFSDSHSTLDQIEKKIITELSALDSNIGYNLHQGGLGGSSYKKVNQYELDGTFIKTWYAIIEASESLNLSYKTIQNCFNGKKPTCGGFQWKDYLKNKDCVNIEPFESKSKKTINQYCLSGKFIKKWNSISEASVSLDLAFSSIGQCCRKLPSVNQIGGYIWRFSDECDEENDIDSVEYKNRRFVSQYSLSGVFIKKFDSISIGARETNQSTSNISSCCNGKRKSAGGYIWKYHEND